MIFFFDIEIESKATLQPLGIADIEKLEKSEDKALISSSSGAKVLIPYILIEKHLKNCNLNFVLVKKDSLLMWHI